MKRIAGKKRDLGGGFFVSRLLPHIEARSIGPFVFFDTFGPVDMPPGKGLDVRPHPHIGLATVTYLFEGGQVHRDSLGTVQEICPGDINWMTAGRGIVHSERTGAAMRAAGHRMHGIQSWVALPKSDEETAPSFQHVAKADLPQIEDDGVALTLIAGHGFGLASPVKVCAPTLYADARFEAGARLHYAHEHEERALFVAEGSLAIDGERFDSGEIALLSPQEQPVIAAEAPARALLFGGAPLDGPRHLWWNFVASSQERIEQAKADWRAMRLGRIAGDDEFIPLPD